jgi:hypothetical protein
MHRIVLTWFGILLLAPPAAALPTEALLDTLQHAAFNYFWNEANPSNGLIKDRSTPDSPCSIASEGFGLSALTIGVQRGWVTREAARDRVLTALQTFWNGPQGSGGSGYIGYKGLFYHFLDMGTAVRTWDCELSSIDTALLLAGVLDAKQFFERSDPGEVQIRQLADSIYYRVDWNFMRNYNPGIMMGWKPGTGFANYGQWIGYNEAMILYLLALGSPTHGVPTNAWTQWTSGYLWSNNYGYTYVNFAPLFGHQYSHCWVDFRSMQDAYMRSQGITYFENSRRATLAQRAYSIANPFGYAGYSDSLWGITAGDGPGGYNARGAPPPQNDDGTLTPTAALSSIPFAPDECIQVAHTLWNNYRTPLWGPYGFKDGLNLTEDPDWYATDVIGIDQGPILLMIENYRTGKVWWRMMQNADIQRGLQRAGFTLVAGVDDGQPATAYALWPTAPNPFRGRATLRYRTAAGGHVRLALYDLGGREVTLVRDQVEDAGTHAATVEAAGLRSGVYWARLECNGVRLSRKLVVLE